MFTGFFLPTHPSYKSPWLHHGHHLHCHNLLGHHLKKHSIRFIIPHSVYFRRSCAMNTLREPFGDLPKPRSTLQGHSFTLWVALKGLGSAKKGPTTWFPPLPSSRCGRKNIGFSGCHRGKTLGFHKSHGCKKMTSAAEGGRKILVFFLVQKISVGK